MATLTVQDIEQGGSAITYSTPNAAGDDFVAADDNRHALITKNGTTGTITLTVSAQSASAPQDGVGVLSVSDISQDIAAGADHILTITRAYIRTNDGKVQFSYDTQTDVDAAAVRLKRID